MMDKKELKIRAWSLCVKDQSLLQTNPLLHAYFSRSGWKTCCFKALCVSIAQKWSPPNQQTALPSRLQACICTTFSSYLASKVSVHLKLDAFWFSAPVWDWVKVWLRSTQYWNRRLWKPMQSEGQKFGCAKFMGYIQIHVLAWDLTSNKGVSDCYMPLNVL